MTEVLRAIAGERVEVRGPRPAFTRERLAEIEPRETGYLVKGLLPRRGVGFFAGPSTTAKTFLAIEVALRISRGEPVCGHRSRQAGVVYVAAEDADGVRRRVKAWRMRHGAQGLFQMVPEPPDLRSPENEAALIATISEAAFELDADGAPLGLIVLDTLSKVAPGADQNASGDMGAVMATLDSLARRFDALVLVLAHTPKDETRGIAGWYGQFGAADAVLMLTRDADDDKLRVATVAKLKNGQDGGKIAFRLEQLEIGEDEDGDPITSCVVAFEDAPSRPARRKTVKLGPAETIALKALRYVIDQGETLPAPAEPGVKFGTLAARRSDVRTHALASGFVDPDMARNSRNVRWNRSVEKLVAAERVRVAGDLIWPV